MTNTFKTPQEALHYHTTGAIERGEKQAIVAVEAPKYIIRRVYNSHGASDYYMGKDDARVAVFSGKSRAQIFTNRNTAYRMTIRLKRLLPTIIGGFPASYEVIELTA